MLKWIDRDLRIISLFVAFQKYFIDADNDEDDDIDGEVDVKSNEDSLVGRSYFLYNDEIFIYIL